MTGVKGSIPWNKGKKGYKCYSKKLDKINWNEIFKKIEDGKSIGAISKNVDICGATIKKYVLIKRKDLINKIKENGRLAQVMYSYKNGQSKLYVELRKSIRAGQIVCEKCGSNKNVQIHHKEELHYDEKYRMWKADNFNNEKDNVLFLCSSCHQKLHYRELGRKHKVKHCKKTGRFLKNE